jgi:hypothetical protein
VISTKISYFGAKISTFFNSSKLEKKKKKAKRKTLKREQGRNRKEN